MLHPNMRMPYVWYIQLCYSAWNNVWNILHIRVNTGIAGVILWKVTVHFMTDMQMLVYYFKKKWNQGRDIRQARVTVSSSMNILRLDVDNCHYCQHLDLLVLMEVVWYLSLAQHLHLVPLMPLQLCYWLLYHYVNYCQTVPVTCSQTS